jgi:ABC-2 type transport system ATP-binding protein
VSEPTLLLEHVAHADHAAERGRARGHLIDASLRHGRGVLAVLGAPEDGSLALSDVLSGRSAPRRGRVRIDDRDPARDPWLRARVGCLGHDAELPRVGTVAQLCALVTSAWPSPEPLRARLEALGLGALLARTGSSLSYAETRSVEAAFALSAPEPRLVVLFEPYLDVVVERARVEAAIAELAAHAAVVVLTASPRDARSFDEVVVLDRGRFVRSSGAGRGELGGPFGVQLHVVVERGARALASALSASDALDSMALELASPADTAGAGRLRLAGPDGARLGRALALAVRDSGARVEAVVESAPQLDEVRAMSEWEQRRRAAFAELHRRGPAPLDPGRAAATAQPLALAQPLTTPQPSAPAPAAGPPPDAYGVATPIDEERS